MALTYATQEEAIRVGTDLRRQGQPNMIIPDGKGRYKVVYTQGVNQSTAPNMEYLTEGGQLEPTREEVAEGQRELAEFKKKREEKPEFRIRKGIQEKKIQEAIEKGTRLSEEDEINKEIETAARRVKVKKAMEQTPEEIAKATLVEKQMLINEQIRKKRAVGSNNPGSLVPIYDENTHQIIDYKWQGKGKNQTFMELSKKGAKSGTQTFANTASNIKSRNMNTGNKTAIVGLPSRMPGVVGEGSPKIMQVPKSPKIIEEGRLGFEAMSQGDRLKQEPNVPRITP